MKLELTLPALERLIGGDNELEVGIRSQIANAFVRKYMKGIADAEMLWKHEIEIKKYINEKIKEEVDIDGLLSGWYIKAGDGFKNKIRAILDECLEKEINQRIRLLIEQRKEAYSIEIERYVKKHLDLEVERQIKKGIEERLKKAQDLLK